MKTLKYDYENPKYTNSQIEKYRLFGQGKGHWHEKWVVLNSKIGDPGGKVVIDLGSSIGTFALKTGHGARLSVGIDLSVDALKEAVSMSKEEALTERVSFVQADAGNLPILTEKADLVLGMDIVEHLPPPILHSMLRESYRVLKKGGRLILHTYPSMFYYFFNRPGKYTPFVLPVLFLPSRTVFRYLGFLHAMIERMRSIRARIRGYGIEQSHCNCQTLDGLKEAVKMAGFDVYEAFSENTFSSYDVTPYMKLWRRLLRGHEATKNNIYVCGMKQ